MMIKKNKTSQCLFTNGKFPVPSTTSYDCFFYFLMKIVDNVQ